MNIGMLNVLSSPLSYLRIRHEEKRWADWVLPVICSLLSTIVLLRYGVVGVVAGKDGLLAKILVVSSVLPGFYIGALAALATFTRPGIDDVMNAPAPMLHQLIGGKSNCVPLTRRRFLTYLFSFLCFESIALMVICMFVSLIGVNLTKIIDPTLYLVLRFIFSFTVLLMFWQMLWVTLLGLYYIGDRLFRPY